MSTCLNCAGQNPCCRYCGPDGLGWQGWGTCAECSSLGIESVVGNGPVPTDLRCACGELVRYGAARQHSPSGPTLGTAGHRAAIERLRRSLIGAHAAGALERRTLDACLALLAEEEAEHFPARARPRGGRTS